MLTEKSFDTGELTINYVEASESGSPLLLLHGLTGWWQFWEWNSFMTHLTPSWHVYATDFRGHGKSGRAADQQYRFVDYAKDTIAFLRGCCTEPAVLIGHSLGAMTSIAVAGQAPELVRAVVLLDPPLYLRNGPTATMPGAANWFGWVYETLKSSPTIEEVAARFRVLEPNSDETHIQDRAANIFSLHPGTVLTAIQNRLMEDWDFEHTLHNITCPTLLMRGDWDHEAAVREEDTAYMQANVTRMTDVKIPSGTHLFPWELIDLTMLPMQKFLQSV